ncbi:MAG: PD40 domain-containing protein [Caldilineaceae bacterium]|nr:PD40 domain-containing protein [Caldilineaceae bacterium]
MSRDKQKSPKSSLSLLAGIVLVAVVIVGLAFIFRSVPKRVQTGQVAISSPIETPTPDKIPMPFLGENVIAAPTVGPDGKLPPPPPTFTPFPTWTPRPTPTRRPGPTVTPFPTRPLTLSAAGSIFYTTQSGLHLWRIPIGTMGEKLEEATMIPLPVDFSLFNVSPSPDGNYLLFQRPAMPGGNPYIYELNSGKLHALFEENSYISGIFYGWHPNSRQILFWNDRDQLLVIDVVSRERTILGFMIGPVQGAALSPDGQNIVYSSYLRTSENQAHEALWMTSTAGSDAHPVFTFDGASYVFGWSPDGQYILYMGGPGVGRTEEAFAQYESRGPLWIVEPDGENPRPLAGPFVAGSGYVPVWSPDSQWIVFTGLDEGQEYGCFPKRKGEKIDWPACQFVGTGVYIENIQSGELRRLTSGIKPVWSPDGRWVAFLSNQSGSTEVWVVQMDGSNLRQVTVDGLIKTEVIWMSEEEVGQ